VSDFDLNLAQQISDIAATAKSSRVFWIQTPKGEHQINSGGSDWCGDCAFYMARHLRKKLARVEWS
jgi:hypothetical protein